MRKERKQLQRPLGYLIAILYIFGSLVWIAASNAWLSALFPGSRLLAHTEAIKDIGLVLFTSLILLFWRLNLGRQITQYQQALKHSQQKYEQIVNLAQEGIWLCDASGSITLANPAFAQFFGVEPENLLGQKFENLVQQRGTWSLQDFLRAPQHIDLCFQSRNGDCLWALCSILPLQDQKGRTAGFLGSASNITARKETEQALQNSEARYRGLFENSPISLWEEDFSAVKEYLDALREQGVTDFGEFFTTHPEAVGECIQLLRVVDVNHTSLGFYNAQSKEEILDHPERIFGEVGREIFSRELTHIANGKREFEFHGINYKLTGEPLDILLRWTVSPGCEDSLARVLVSIMDITERRKAEEQLRIAEERYRMLIEQVAAVIYIDHINNGGIYISPKIEALLGFSPQEYLGTPSFWLDRIHPDDYERVTQENQRTNQTLEPFEMEYRVRHASGQYLWIHDQALCTWDDRLQVPVWHGFLLDITARKQMEAALRQSEERFRQLLENQGEGIVVFSIDSKVEYMNRAAETLFKIPASQVVGQPLKEFVPPDQVESILQEMQQIAPHSNIERQILLPDINGQPLWLLLTISPSLDPQGQHTGGIAVCRNINQIKHEESELRHQSTHDMLTGLFNRRHFESNLAEFSKNGAYPISLIFMDVDNLKTINDRHGHLAGDQYLGTLAEELRSTVRGQDIVARLGGDEFAILLPNTPPAACAAAVQRLRNRLKRYNQNHPEMPLCVSIGSATAQNDEETIGLVHNADQNMYQEKTSKRPQTLRSA